MFGTFITFFILIFSFKIFEITNLFLKILSFVTQKSVSNLFYYNLNLNALNSINVNLESMRKIRMI